MSLIPTGAYINNTTPWWSQDFFGTPANIEVSTITVNPLPAGNILLQHTISSGTEYNAPLIFQRPAADINAPSETLVMNTSLTVPTKPVDGEYITATKTSGTVYDDIAVAGLQVYGNQTTAGNTGAAAYLTGSNGNLIIAAQDSVYVSSLFVSTLTATNVISTTATTGTSLTLTTFLSSASVTSGNVSTNTISTSQIVSKDIFTSTLTVSTLNAPNFTVSTLSTVVIDTKVTLTSTLSLTGSPTNINLGLGDVIQGLVGGAATQALGVGLGGAALVTGSVALVTGRTSGGVNSNIFQTVNGSTQLQFSTIGQAVSSVFLTVNSPNPLTTPGLEISTTQGVAAGTYCVRSVGDPLYITNNVSSIQMYGQWVPVIQPTATIPAVAISSLTVSSINGLPPGGGGGGGIPSTLAASTITVNGSLTQSGTGTFNWGGNTMSGTQVVIARPTAINNTLTTSGGAFLNAGATVNSGLTVASGGATVSGGGNLSVTGNAFVTGVLQGGTVQAGSGVTVSGGIFVNTGGIQINSGNFNMTGGASVANITNLNVNQNLTVNQRITTNAISTTNISTNNINVFTINNQTYPPPSGGGIPSTLNASTINFDGGLTNIGSAPITTGTLNATTVNTNNFQAAAISTNTLSTNTIRAAAISSFMVSSANGVITSLFVSSVNGAAYPPGGGGGGGIPSTLNASTINVNGGITIANGGIINTSFEPIRSFFLSTNFISTGLITADTVRALILSTPVIRADAVSTNFISCQTIRAESISSVYLSTLTTTASNIGCFQFSSLTGSINTLTTNTLTTNSISTINLSTTVTTAVAISTNTISTNALVAFSGNVTSLSVSSINGTIPGTLGLPVGSITIWAGGLDTGAGQSFNIPTGWFLCDGSELDKLVYANLFGVIGQKYAMNRPLTGNNFYLPDLTFAVPMGTPLRNYVGTLNLGAPSFQCSVQTWTSDFAPSTLSSVTQTWKISQTIGGTLNYGTFFPANAITQPGYPSVYVSNILSYDGNVGYVVVKSLSNTPIPQTLGTIIAKGSGTVPQDNSGTYLYTLGSYGVESAYPQVTHNQTKEEVGGHTHSYNRYGLFGSSGLVNGNQDPSKSSAFQDTSSNQISTISTFGATNVGTYTAPNFINMLYIIKF